MKRDNAYARAAQAQLGKNPPDPRHIITLKENIDEVRQLIQISHHMHDDVDCNHNLDVLYKGAIVLLVACWESYIEDMAEEALEFMLEHASDPHIFPASLLKLISQDYSDMKIWALAGDGWKSILKNNYKKIQGLTLKKFHSPKSQKIDDLYKKTIGLDSLSQHWSWQGMSARQAARKLDNLIALRGDIAHRVQTNRTVWRKHVYNYIDFILQLSVECSNAVGAYVFARLSHCPWGPYHFSREEED